MIETDKRKAIFLLHQEGMSVREIARRLALSRNTVREIIRLEGGTPDSTRGDKRQIDPELLQRLYGECEGWVRRICEKLAEEEGIQVKYSTLTRMLRELGISAKQKARCGSVPDEPGAEMQHDTTVYKIKLGGRTVQLVASLLYLRYSKRRYLMFYRAFNRFKMKCFLHEALIFWGYAPGQCVIDNTNLARLAGTGARAVIAPEMEAFSKQYGFKFVCHEKGHANRKAGEERSFWTVETNFLPGRVFETLEDLNQQALLWSTVRLENKPQARTGLIPALAFEHERHYLTKLPAHLPAPYQVHHRGTDQYGYAAFGGNFYWVPASGSESATARRGTGRDDVKVLQYSGRLKIYLKRECLAEYPLPADGTTNQRYPAGGPPPPCKPRNRKRPTEEEEKRLRAIGGPVSAYLDFVLTAKGLGRHPFLRKLLALSRKMTAELFIKSIERAHKYQITSLETIERIAALTLHQGTDMPASVEIDEHFRDREAYQEGALTEPPDLSIYDTPPEEEQDHE